MVIMKRKIEETVAENEFDSKESEEIDGKGINFKRKFEHVDGNWPSHVFISIGKLQKDSNYFRYFTSSIIERLKSLQRIVDDTVDHFLENNSFGIQRSSFEVEENLHISLSHPFVLRYHQIKPFVECFQKHCRDFQR
jgi:hypothetical protein